MRYIPGLCDDSSEMLAKIGVKNVGDLFSSVPEDIRVKIALDLPKRLSELGLLRFFEELSSKNSKPLGKNSWTNFLGAGCYDHYVPASVDHLASRSEFYTAYTPYQAELSQGTLQSIFEFQSLICAVSGMEISNASVYDGANAAAEACLMAERIKRKKKMLIAETLHPEYRQVIEAYTKQKRMEIVDIPFKPDGLADYSQVEKETDIACVVVQYPNFFGNIEDVKGAKKLSEQKDALLVTVTTEPVSLGVLKSPGELGADIFAGEGQSFGNYMAFGGPHLGLLATKKEYTRNIPGRIASETIDAEGKKGYVLYMATREQHIRREKATSNICTNNALCALKATIYLALLGKRGFRELASSNLSNAQYLREELSNLRGVQVKFDAPTFNEFVFSSSLPASTILNSLKEAGIIGGIPLEGYFREYKTSILVSVTEMRTKKDMDAYIEAVKSCL